MSSFFFPTSEVSDEDNSIALMYQTISDLPPANRDTLAFLIIHLQRSVTPALFHSVLRDDVWSAEIYNSVFLDMINLSILLS